MASSSQQPIPPPWPIALRHNTIAQEETLLTIRNRPEPWHPLDYTVEENGIPLLSVHGHPWTLGQRRVFRDKSGFPLFELRSRWYNSSMLELKLPGETGTRILTAKCRVAMHAPKAVLRFWNVVPRAGADATRYQGQSLNGEDTVLEVQTEDLYNFVHVVVVEDRKIAYIERITDPEELAEGQKPPFRFRPKWKVRVAQGVDLALIAVVVVIVGQQVAEVGSRDG